MRAELLVQVVNAERRMMSGAQRLLQQHKTHLQGLARGLGDPKRLLETAVQRLDHLSSKLDLGLQNWLRQRQSRLNELSAKFSPQGLLRRSQDMLRIVSGMGERILNTEQKILKDRRLKLQNLGAMLESLSFERVLDRGYAVVFDDKGGIVPSAKKLSAGEDISIRFRDGEAKARTK